MTWTYTTDADGRAVVRVTCDVCGFVTFEPRAWSAPGWTRPKKDHKFIDVCADCNGRNASLPNTPHKSVARRRERRIA